MKQAIIGLAVGVVVGAACMWLVTRRGSTTDTTDTARATSAPATGSAAANAKPTNPIVGTWRVRLGGIDATYQFAEDGAFVLSFKGMPQRTPKDQGTNEAGGTWRVDGKQLVLTNGWSNTPMTIVGERETATIVSLTPDRLELEHDDRRGKRERLTFERVQPFTKGKVDRAAVIGRWRSQPFMLDLKPGGDATITNNTAGAGPRGGAWSQAGDTLTLRLTDREESYDIRSVDDLRMVLHRVGSPPTSNVVFERILPASELP